jgi:hypothetical protein
MGFELLIFLISPIINAWWDSAHGETSHLKSLFIRGGGLIIIGIGMSFIIPNPWSEITNSIWWLYILIGFSVEFMLFDYLYNWFSGHSWKYIGAEKDHKDDFTWKIYNKVPPYIMLVIKTFILIVFVSMYFQVDRL